MTSHDETFQLNFVDMIYRWEIIQVRLIIETNRDRKQNLLTRLRVILSNESLSQVANDESCAWEDAMKGQVSMCRLWRGSNQEVDTCVSHTARPVPSGLRRRNFISEKERNSKISYSGAWSDLWCLISGWHERYVICFTSPAPPSTRCPDPLHSLLIIRHKSRVSDFRFGLISSTRLRKAKRCVTSNA